MNARTAPYSNSNYHPYHSTFRVAAYRAPARPIAAGRVKRMGAFCLDFMVYGALSSVLSVLFNVIGTTAASLLYAAFHDCTLGPGRSIGRASVGHRLLMADGSEVTHSTAIGRNIVRWGLWLVAIPFLVDVILFFAGDGRLLADYIMGTMVSEAVSQPAAPRRVADTVRMNAVYPIDEELAAAERELDFESTEQVQRDLEAFETRVDALS